MQTITGTDILQLLVNSGVAKRSEIKGCSENEIREIEEGQGVKITGLYLSLLHTMGKSAGRFLVGTHFYYPSLRDLKKWAQDLLRDEGTPVRLPDDAFVFLSHQGYQFMYFPTRGTDAEDPPVFYFIEGTTQFEKKWERLSTCLRELIEDEGNAGNE